MAYKVMIDYPTKEVGITPFYFEIKKTTKSRRRALAAYGRLEISKGSIRWFPRGESEPIRWSWTKLNKEMMKSLKQKNA